MQCNIQINIIIILMNRYFNSVVRKVKVIDAADMAIYDYKLKIT